MPAEEFHKGYPAHASVENSTESDTIQAEKKIPTPLDIQRRKQDISEAPADLGVDAASDKDALFVVPESPAYDKHVLGIESEGEPAEEVKSTQEMVLEEVASEQDVQKGEILSLREANLALIEEMKLLRQEIAELKGEKTLADKQPRRVRKQEGVTERLVKYTDGSFAWETISVDPDPVDTEPTTDQKTGADVDLASTEQESSTEPELPKEPGMYYKGRKVEMIGGAKGYDPKNRDKESFVVSDVLTRDVIEVDDQDMIKVVSAPVEDKEPETTPAKAEVTPADDAPTAAATPEATSSDSSPNFVILDPNVAAPASTTGEVPATVVTPEDDVAPIPGKELELFQGELGEKARKGFRGKLKDLREFGGAAFWAAEFGSWGRGVKSWVVDRGVDDSMNENEKKEKRKKNRRVAVAAGAGLVIVGALAAGWLVSKGMSSGGPSRVANNALDLGPGEHNGFDNLSPTMGADSVPGTERVVNLPLDTGSGPGVESIPEAPAIPQELFTVDSGDGGIELFNKLGLNSEAWYANAQTLLDQFPQDFYLEGNDVRIAHAGPLTQGAQDFIKTIR